MSTINVNNLAGRGGATPNLPDGAVISGVATVTNLKPTNVNVSGAVTATTFDGNLKSTGTPTLGLGVTINSSGLVVSGVTTAGIGSFTTLYGDGSNLTGVAGTIGVWDYNPDVSDSNLALAGTGIAVTFSTKIVAGSGTATMKIVNAGVAGTTIQSWGVSSCTYVTQKLTFGSIISSLQSGQTYQIDIPEGFVKDMGGTEYVGTAWTFASTNQVNGELFTLGTNTNGVLGQNAPSDNKLSSPVQITGGGDTWVDLGDMTGIPYCSCAIKSDGTLWVWGENNDGELGLNDIVSRSSPTQIPGTTWGESDLTKFGNRNKVSMAREASAGIKQDGTLWTWGRNQGGRLGTNQETDVIPRVSSPVQVPGTTWKQVVVQPSTTAAIKTDGTLWTWGSNTDGRLGINQPTSSHRSSPTQIPGTNWKEVSAEMTDAYYAIKTDGTLWAWGKNDQGALAQNSAGTADQSSPVQIPGTTWATVSGAEHGAIATKTDGTLWAWGNNTLGRLGQSQPTNSHTSSPVQIPGTSWSTTRGKVTSEEQNASVIKTDGTLWTWGRNEAGELGQNQSLAGLSGASSPVQIPGTNWRVINDPYDSLHGIRLT